LPKCSLFDQEFHVELPLIKPINQREKNRGIRDTGRVLGIHKNTVMRRLKKKPPACYKSILTSPSTLEEITVRIENALDAEWDEQWSYVGHKANQRWLWYAIDHATNTLLAYVFSKRKEEVFKQL